jgi:hypothetical protein
MALQRYVIETMPDQKQDRKFFIAVYDEHKHKRLDQMFVDKELPIEKVLENKFFKKIKEAGPVITRNIIEIIEREIRDYQNEAHLLPEQLPFVTKKEKGGMIHFGKRR